jgi:epoxyqueuosine reductase
MTLTEVFKEEARRLGFELAGVTTANPPLHWPVFQAWLEAGCHGEMAYLANERSRTRRADPRRILPECQSILVLGTRYPAPLFDGEMDEGKLTGRVAAYACGKDYHDVLVPRLEALVNFAERQMGRPISNRFYTDTGPLLERDLAQRAGLGWIGKNTCLIHPRMGSYFFLAEILLGIDLEPDSPFITDHCGTCTRCLEACPTGCIGPNRTIDARRCISYLSIELKRAIPRGLRPFLGNWVFGCDICQQVCPWNRRFAVSQADPVFSSGAGRQQPDLLEEISLSLEDFSVKFKGSPLKRAKRRAYLRNVAVALGNHIAQGNRSAIPALVNTLLNDPDALVRQHAVWALAQDRALETQKYLRGAAAVEQDQGVLEEMRAALILTNQSGDHEG